MTGMMATTLPEVIGGAGGPRGNSSHRRPRWVIWSVALAIVTAGGLWYGFFRTSGPTLSATVAACSQALEGSTTQATNLQPGVVGLGRVASIATFDTPSGLRWCFDGMGVATGPITRYQMRSTVSAPVAVVDGNLKGNVLMLVHLAKSTNSVVVTTEDSLSTVLARSDDFEVLNITMTKWPPWRAPWTRSAVSLGRIIGFDSEGRVTSSQAFTWCPGSIDSFPGRAC
jgi:hypothetical protein